MKRNPKYEHRIYHLVPLARAAELTGITSDKIQQQIAAETIWSSATGNECFVALYQPHGPDALLFVTPSETVVVETITQQVIQNARSAFWSDRQAVIQLEIPLNSTK